MQTKLTLRLDDELIAQAKAWAAERGISLSEAVAGFFAQLPRRDAPAHLSSWTQELVGAATAVGPTPSEKAMRVDYRAHQERKYQ